MKKIVYLSCIGWDTPMRLRPHHLCRMAAQTGYEVYHAILHLKHKKVSATRTSVPGIYQLALTIDVYPQFKSGGVLHSPSSIQGIADLMGDDDVVIWVNVPYWAPIAIALRDLLPSAVLIYDVLDRYENFKDLAPRADHLLKLHDKLLHEANLVTYTAKDMELYVTGANKLLHLPNGCDPVLWNVPRRKGGLPIIGYMGVMTDWFDTNVIRTLMTAREYQLELAGPIAKPVRKVLWGSEDLKGPHIGIIPYPKLHKE